MNDAFKADSTRISRRLMLLQGVASVAGIPIILAVSANKAAAGKFSQKSVLYQPTPKGDRKCSNCALFEPPNACKSVEGVISPDGWCAIWRAK